MGISGKIKKWNKADFTLLTAGCLFFFAVIVRIYHPNPNSFEVKLLLTVTEAGLVGGVADWFAVTALFRRPLGFPYHTSLVPRNRKRLIETLAKAVEEDFLSKESIRKRLAEIRLIDWLIDKTEKIGGGAQASFIRQIITNLIYKLIDSLEPARIGRYSQEIIKEISKNEPIAPYLLQASAWAVNTGKLPLLYNFLLNELTDIVQRPETRNKIYNYLQNFKTGSIAGNWLSELISRIMEETDTLNLEQAADTLQAEILIILKNAKEENHPIRQWFLEQMTATVKELSENALWAEAIESCKNGFLTRLDLASPITAAVTSFQKMATESSLDYQNRIKEQIVDFIMSETSKYWQIFKADHKIKEEVESFFLYLADSLLEAKHSLVGIVVTNALSQLTDEGLVQFVEEKASDDLAWIRINGVIVGSIAGLLLGLFLHFVYDPFLKSFDFF